MQASGTTSGAASTAGDDEGAAFEEGVSVELGGELVTGEEPLVDRPALARIQTDGVAAEVARQETCAAGGVERAHGRERRDTAIQRSELVAPARSVAVGVETLAEPPVVVLGCAPVVVGLHGS